MELDENIHHIFTIPEVREKIIGIFGDKSDERLIEKEIKWVWKNLPKYKIDKGKHIRIHRSTKKIVHSVRYKLKNSKEKNVRNKILAQRLINVEEEVKRLREENSNFRSRNKELVNRFKVIKNE